MRDTAVFELFVWRLLKTRRFLLVAGIDDLTRERSGYSKGAMSSERTRALRSRR
jgi:hypothetical protein